MCGIAGIWNYAGEVPAELRLQSMLRAMRHRGPDGGGSRAFVGGAFGMVRLALVDLSPRGDQPMWSPCGRVAIVFNGEMYNFREERARLESLGRTFRTTTDTEVVLELYLEHGENFVDRVRGMYALAVFDWRESGFDHPPAVSLVRGPCGIKPLYVAQLGGGPSAGFVFASEIRGLLASGLVTPRVSEAGLCDVLRHGRVLQPRTIVDGVRMLGPGTVERYVPGRDAQCRRFWSIPPYTPRNESFDEAAVRLRHVLEESIRLHALADAPMGIFLSGGLDSTAIAALMRPHVSRLNAYTFRFPDVRASDEVAEAADTAQRLDCDHHIVEVTARDARELLPLFAEQLDQPTVDGINTWFLSRAAARDVKGVLSGVGGDEWFSGYSVTRRMLQTARTPAGRMRAMLGRVIHNVRGRAYEERRYSRLDAAASYRSPVALWSHPHTVFSPGECETLLGRTPGSLGGAQIESDLRSLLQFAVGKDWSDESPIGMSCLLDSYAFMMCQLLRDSDAAGMAASLELRVPFVDVKVIEFARSCSDEHKLTLDDVRAGRSKRVLAHALRDVLPPEATRRPKRGFVVPNDLWVRGELSATLDDTCGPDALRRRGWFDPALVRRLIDERRRNESLSFYPQVWTLMVAELWARAVLDRPAPTFGAPASPVPVVAVGTPLVAALDATKPTATS